MKNLLLFLFIVNTLSVFSQSISVEAHQNEVNPTCCMTLLDDIGTDITVRNLTNSTIDILVSRQIISATPGTINYFCWTACYGSETSISPQSKLLDLNMLMKTVFRSILIIWKQIQLVQQLNIAHLLKIILPILHVQL